MLTIEQKGRRIVVELCFAVLACYEVSRIQGQIDAMGML